MDYSPQYFRIYRNFDIYMARTISKKKAKEIKEKTLAYYEGMRKLGHDITKTDARRIVVREMGMLRPEEVEARDMKFRGIAMRVKPKY